MKTYGTNNKNEIKSTKIVFLAVKFIRKLSLHIGRTSIYSFRNSVNYTFGELSVLSYKLHNLGHVLLQYGFVKILSGSSYTLINPRHI